MLALIATASAPLVARGQGVGATVTVETTLTSATINCDLPARQNNDANATVRFRRKNSDHWRRGLDLSRVAVPRPFKGSQIAGETYRLSGSIFGLSPATVYEIELSLSVIGGGAQSIAATATTRGFHQPNSKSNRFEVRESDDLDRIKAKLRPGDAVLFHAGSYFPGQEFQIAPPMSGMAEKPILFRAYGDGKVVFDSVRIEASHVWLDGLTVNHGINGMKNATDVWLTRNTVNRAFHAINAYGTSWHILDNKLIGHSPETGSYAGEGIEFKQRGHVAAFNDISLVGDGISYGNGNIDVHNNSIHDITDDFIEPDYSWDNYRIWENRGWNGGNNGISFQPMNGGPWYLIRNQISGTSYNPFKLRGGQGPKIVVGNTIVSSRPVQNVDRLFHAGGIWANNFWVISPRDQLGYGRLPNARLMRLWGYDRYDCSRDVVFRLAGRKNLAALQRIGIERGSNVVDARASATNVPQDTKVGTKEAIYPILGGLLSDGGTANAIPGLNNLVGPFLGAAPDVGAYESGLGTPWVGPRRFVSHLAFGLPNEWVEVTNLNLSEYPGLEIPAQVQNARLLLVRQVTEKSWAYLLVRHVPVQGEDRWKYFTTFLDGDEGDEILLKPVRFRDGLAASIVQRNIADKKWAIMLGSRVDQSGITTVYGGAEISHLAKVANQMFTFVRSLYYPWPLDDSS